MRRGDRQGALGGGGVICCGAGAGIGAGAAGVELGGEDRAVSSEVALVSALSPVAAAAW